MSRTAVRRRGRSIVWAAAALAIAAVALLPVAAGAAPSGNVVAGTNPTATTAVVRGAHFSPNTPGVDVYLTAYSGGRSSLWLSNLGYGDVSSYRSVKAGPYVVSMRLHGASPSSPAGLTWTLNARPGAAYTVAAVGMNKNLKGVVLRDRLTPPSAKHGLVRVIQAASRAPHTKVVAEPHTLVAADAAFATTTAYATVPVGTWTVTASTVPGASPSTTKRVVIDPASVNSLVVLDNGHDGIEVRVLRDASGAAVAPRGSIDAGGGGTAPNRPFAAGDTAWTAGGVGLAALAGAALLVRRRSVTAPVG